MKRKATARPAKATSRQSTLNFPTSSEADLVAESASAETSTKSGAKNSKKGTADFRDDADKRNKSNGDSSAVIPQIQALSDSMSSASSNRRRIAQAENPSNMPRSHVAQNHPPNLEGLAEQTGLETGHSLLTRILTERKKSWKGRGEYKEPAISDTTDLPLLPNSWSVASLDQVTNANRPICYGILMPKENVPTGVLFVKVKDMKGDKIDLESLHRTTPEIAAKYARASLKTGDLLLSIRGTYGRVAEVPPELDGGNITQDTARLDVSALCCRRFLAMWLRSAYMQNYFKRVARGVAVKGVNIGDIKPAPVPLPPLPEQHRIVAEIEKQFTRLDAGVAALIRVQANLKRYRAAVLKAACEGKLVPTEAEIARREGRTYETGEQLLQRILTERCQNWQGRGQYKAPAAPDTGKLSSLPDGWTWASVEQLGNATTGFTPPKNDASLFGGHIPFFKPSDLDVGYYVRKFRESLTDAGAAHGRVLPPLSILVTCIGATIGKTGLARVRCTTNQQINAITVPPELVLPQFVYWFFSSPFCQRQIIDNASATTLPILNKSRFEALPIPLPPLAEQTRIVAEVERRLSVVDELEVAISANLQRSLSLRRSILQKAFTGETG